MQNWAPWDASQSDNPVIREQIEEAIVTIGNLWADGRPLLRYVDDVVGELYLIGHASAIARAAIQKLIREERLTRQFPAGAPNLVQNEMVCPTHKFREAVTPPVGPTPAKTPRPILDPETSILTFNGRQLKLTQGERDVLKVLILKGACSLEGLRDANDRPDRVLRGLIKKYPELETYISLPGGPGKGGYSTTIKLATTPP
jgi:hypothetical protein